MRSRRSAKWSRLNASILLRGCQCKAGGCQCKFGKAWLFKVCQKTRKTDCQLIILYDTGLIIASALQT